MAHITEGIEAHAKRQKEDVDWAVADLDKHYTRSLDKMIKYLNKEKLRDPGRGKKRKTPSSEETIEEAGNRQSTTASPNRTRI